MFAEGRKVIEEKKGRRWVLQSSGEESVVGSQERDTIERRSCPYQVTVMEHQLLGGERTGEIIRDLLSKFP